MISKPFGGYRNILEIDDIHFEDPLLSKNVKEYLKIRPKEHELNIKFNMIAGKMGLSNTRWARVTIIMFGLWTICTSLVCFQKPDFLNLTIAIMGLLILLDP